MVSHVNFQGERDELEDGDGENGENGEERVYAANEIARIQDLAKVIFERVFDSI